MARNRLVEQAHTADGAAVLIQKCWRRYFLRFLFLSLSDSAVRIQTVERRQLCLSKYACILFGAVHLQAIYRGCKARQQILVTNKMAVRVQAAERRRQSHANYANIQTGIVRLQAQYRGFLIRQLLTELAAAIIIQNWCSTVVPRLSFLSYRQAAVRIQTAERRRQCQSRYFCVKRGILLLQTYSRGLFARQQVRLCGRAAARIQAMWRATFVSRRYPVLKTGVVAMQLTFFHLSYSEEDA